MPQLFTPKKLIEPGHFKTVALLVAVAGAVIGGSVVVNSHASTKAVTSTPSIYLTPTKGIIAPGSTLTVELREDSLSSPVNAIQANVTYPGTLLELTSIDTATSAFAVSAEGSSNSGLIKIARGTITPVSGSQQVAFLNFKVIGTSGTASLAFDPASTIISSTTNTALVGSRVGATFHLR